MATFDYHCIDDNCDAEIEYEIEPQCAGSYDEPPSGGWALPNVEDDKCPECKRDLTDEKFLEKVYDAWVDSHDTY